MQLKMHKDRQIDSLTETLQYLVQLTEFYILLYIQCTLSEFLIQNISIKWKGNVKIIGIIIFIKSFEK